LLPLHINNDFQWNKNPGFFHWQSNFGEVAIKSKVKIKIFETAISRLEQLPVSESQYLPHKCQYRMVWIVDPICLLKSFITKEIYPFFAHSSTVFAFF